MRFLLDSQALVAWLLRQRFDRALRRRIERGGATVSAASVYELTHKLLGGKLALPVGILEAIDASAFRPLAVSVEHAAGAARLPRHHRDPFDRMLIAQAQIESLTIVTRDETFSRYDVDVVGF